MASDRKTKAAKRGRPPKAKPDVEFKTIYYEPPQFNPEWIDSLKPTTAPKPKRRTLTIPKPGTLAKLKAWITRKGK